MPTCARRAAGVQLRHWTGEALRCLAAGPRPEARRSKSSPMVRLGWSPAFSGTGPGGAAGEEGAPASRGRPRKHERSGSAPRPSSASAPCTPKPQTSRRRGPAGALGRKGQPRGPGWGGGRVGALGKGQTGLTDLINPRSLAASFPENLASGPAPQGPHLFPAPEAWWRKATLGQAQ